MDEEKERITRNVAAELRGVIASKTIMKKDIAKDLEMQVTTLSRYLNGHREIPVSTFLRICTHIGADPGAILDKAAQDL